MLTIMLLILAQASPAPPIRVINNPGGTERWVAPDGSWTQRNRNGSVESRRLEGTTLPRMEVRDPSWNWRADMFPTTDWSGLFADLRTNKDAKPEPRTFPLPSHREISTTDWICWRSEAIRSYNAGLDFAANGEWDKAAEAFGKSVEAWPAFADAHYGLGVAWLNLKNPQLAHLSFHETLKVAPGHVKAASAMTLSSR